MGIFITRSKNVERENNSQKRECVEEREREEKKRDIWMQLRADELMMSSPSQVIGPQAKLLQLTKHVFSS